MPSMLEAIAMIFPGKRLMPREVPEELRQIQEEIEEYSNDSLALGFLLMRRIKYRSGMVITEEPDKVNPAQREQMIEEIVKPYLQSSSPTDWRYALAAAMVTATIPLNKYRIDK